MRKIILSFFILLNSCANDNNILVNDENIFLLNKNDSFPITWLGKWEGKCKVINNNPNNDFGDFQMKLSIDKINNNKYSWKIEYISTKINQVRDYYLVPVNLSKGHYMIDENNGIYLDAFLIDNNTLVESFDVGNSSLYIKHKLVNKNLMSVEFTTFSSKSIRKSGSSPNIVNTYDFFNYQDCTLNKTLNGK